MLSAALLLFANTLLFSLRLSGGGSFPKPLTAAEEREWLEKYAKGNPEARQVLIERNLRLVAHIIKKYYTQSADQEDLISIGTIGLIKGISSFDPAKGARLATYAARCIENAILSKRPTLLPAPPEALLHTTNAADLPCAGQAPPVGLTRPLVFETMKPGQNLKSVTAAWAKSKAEAWPQPDSVRPLRFAMTASSSCAFCSAGQASVLSFSITACA